MSQLETLHERAAIASSTASIDSAAEAKINRLWEQIHSGLDVTEDGSFGPFLSAFIRERYQNTPADERHQRICNSGNYLCATLNGQLPTALRPERGRFGSTRVTLERARDYAAENPGCVVVKDALEAFDEERAEVKQNLLEIIEVSRQQGSNVRISTDNVPGAPSD